MERRGIQSSELDDGSLQELLVARHALGRRPLHSEVSSIDSVAFDEVVGTYFHTQPYIC